MTERFTADTITDDALDTLYAERDQARRIAVALENETAAQAARITGLREQQRAAASAALSLRAQTPTAAQTTLDRIRSANNWTDVWTALGMYYGMKPEKAGAEARARRRSGVIAGLADAEQRLHSARRSTKRAETERDRLAAEVVRLRAGEQQPDPNRPIALCTAPEWIWHWNRSAAESRLATAQRVLDSARQASTCFEGNHRNRLDQLQRRAEQAEAERDAAYRERAHLIAYLAALHPSHIGPTDPTAPDWPVLIVETPAGQMSWHIAPRDADLVEHVEPTGGTHQGWDGHTTEEKYRRLRELTRAALEELEQPPAP
ncbi:hypothetical protein ACMA1D_02080 [Streptomyces sp. 796.1]|uniref:hypothetical protein n=1 Tax=Streptomyces sp. 796.1 TaxID=3163029 RepID=UPI0039C97352